VNGSRRFARVSRALLAVMATTVGAIGVHAEAGARSEEPSARGLVGSVVPFWCQWIPPQWWPPECRPTPPPTSTTTTTTSTTTTVPGGTTTIPSPTTTTTVVPGGNVEAHFAARGPWAVSSVSASDAAGSYVVFHPTNLGASGFRHPIVTWGNGTGSAPGNYDFTLRHLASWGFVVVASTSGQTGWGTEVLAAADYVLRQQGATASPFFQKLDVANVAALGHSQGATGAVNAQILSDGRISSIVPINFVDPMWFNPPEQMPAFGEVDAPIFFLTGGSDFLSTPTAQQNYYDQVPGAALKAALAGAGHNEIQEADNDMVGYATAWLMYTLRADGFARTAFVGSPSQIAADNGWQHHAQKNLP
jgi:pimeloyl-ACP methyl ester carboxylesterase